MLGIISLSLASLYTSSTCEDVMMLFQDSKCCSSNDRATDTVSCAVKAGEMQSRIDELEFENSNLRTYATSYLNHLEEISKDQSYLNQPGKMSLPVMGYPERSLDQALELLGITKNMSSEGIKVMILDDHYSSLVLEEEAGVQIDDPDYSRLTYTNGLPVKRYERFRDFLAENSTNITVSTKLVAGTDSTHGNKVYYWMKNIIPDATFYFAAGQENPYKNFRRVFEWAEEMGVNVINLSWGRYWGEPLFSDGVSLEEFRKRTDELLNVIEEYYAKGIILFQSSGNDPKIWDHYGNWEPRMKDLSSHITVGSLSGMHTAVVGATDVFSNFDSNPFNQNSVTGHRVPRNTPDVIAPVFTVNHDPSSILYKLQDDFDGLYATSFGAHATSWASPIAAAAFALGFNNKPANIRTIQQYKHRFLQTAMFGDYKTVRFGFGIPDISRSLDPLKPQQVFGMQKTLNSMIDAFKSLNIEIPSLLLPPSTGLRWVDPIPEQALELIETYVLGLASNADFNLKSRYGYLALNFRWLAGTDVLEGDIQILVTLFSDFGVTRETIYPLPPLLKTLFGGKELMEPKT